MIFDQERTVARLEALPVRLRVGIGVVCLERVLPIAEAVADTGLVRQALLRIGRWAEGESMTFREVQDLLDAHARRGEAAKAVEADERDDEDADDDDDHDDDDDDAIEDVAARGPTRGALDRMIDALDGGVGALAGVVHPEAPHPSSAVATAMAAACNVVERFARYCDANDLLAFDELAWQARVLAEAETGSDVGRLRALLEVTPAWTEHLDDAF